MNARRHGLATRLCDIPEEFVRAQRLAGILVENCALVADEALIIAENHLDLQRIRVVRHRVLHELINSKTVDELEATISEIAKINRYARRAMSKRRTALNEISKVGD